jgi:hypothetical protein
VKTIEQRFGAAVGVGIEGQMRVAVPGEEAGEAQHVAVGGAADDHGSGAAALEESDATQDQRAHDALAEIGFRDQHVAESRASE